MAHTPIARPLPGRIRMQLAHAARMALAQPAIGAHDAGPRTAASRGAKWSGGMTLLDNRSPRIVVLRRMADLRRRWRCLSRGDRVRAAGARDCDRPRQDRLPGGSGGVSGGASTDHPSGHAGP
jgi:hypothetical protein